MKRTYFNKKISNLLFQKKSLLCIITFFVVSIQYAQQSTVIWDLTSTGTPETLGGTFTGGTVTITQSGATGTHDVRLRARSSSRTDELFTNGGFGANGQSKSITFTFSTPVRINSLTVSDINRGSLNGGWNDVATFSNSFTSSTGTSVNGFEFDIDPSTVTYTTSIDYITTFTVDFPLTATLDHAYVYWVFEVTPCDAGSIAPPLSGTTITNTCPTTSVNLNALHTGSIPNNTTLVWSTDNDSSDGLDMTGNAEDGNGDGVVDDPTTVEVVGTYYAYYYDATDTCYSPVSAGVSFTLAACCNAGSIAPKFN